MATETANNATNDLATISEKLDSLQATFAKFANAAVEMLSGNQASQAPARRRGRPPKTAAAATTDRVVEASKPKEMHPLARQALSLIEKTGRVSQSDLATEMKIERSAVEYHTKQLVADGKIVKRTVYPQGTKTILYYRHDWASFKGE